MRARVSWAISLTAALVLGYPVEGSGQTPDKQPQQREQAGKPPTRPSAEPSKAPDDAGSKDGTADTAQPDKPVEPVEPVEPEAAKRATDAGATSGAGGDTTAPSAAGETAGEDGGEPAEVVPGPDAAGTAAEAGAQTQGAASSGQPEVGAAAGAAAEPGAVPPPSPLLPSDEGTALEVPSPEALEQRLAEEVPEDYAGVDNWTAPVPVFTLHGYMRMRGELMDTFWLGRPTPEQHAGLEEGDVGTPDPGQGPDPFSDFIPLERRIDPNTGTAPNMLDCADEGRTETSQGRTCDVDTLQFANLRLRLSPELNLSEDVRVKTTFDIFDNVVAGEPPSTFYGVSRGEDRRPVEGTVFTGTSLSDTVIARRAWAEVRNRTLGELRFGRMPQHWGLGMYYNAGNGLDDDYSTDLDRVLGITKLAGLYLSASYDFVAEGLSLNRGARPIDQSQLDDVDQFTFSVARRHTSEELASDLERGELILNGGLLFSIRNQDSVYEPRTTGEEEGTPLRTIEATHYTTDLWALLRYRGLRIEGELAWVTGSMDDVLENPGELDISQLGYALETELRLLDDQLGLYIYHGLASGDSDVEGLSSNADYINQLGEHDGTVSTFRFHPSYHVDLILWRNLMRQVTGAWYVRPGLSYDFLRSDFGQLLGARLDVTYSRATAFVQTWGNDPDLGIEINGSLYWRSEDGAELDDGYHAQLQYGVLFPMRGLGYNDEDTDLEAAQTLRLLLGVVF